MTTATRYMLIPARSAVGHTKCVLQDVEIIMEEPQSRRTLDLRYVSCSYASGSQLNSPQTNQTSHPLYKPDPNYTSARCVLFPQHSLSPC